MMEEYADEIYHPGDDVTELAAMTETQKTEYRKEIEEAFQSPDAFIVKRDK